MSLRLLDPYVLCIFLKLLDTGTPHAQELRSGAFANQHKAGRATDRTAKCIPCLHKNEVVHRHRHQLITRAHLIFPGKLRKISHTTQAHVFSVVITHAEGDSLCNFLFQPPGQPLQSTLVESRNCQHASVELTCLEVPPAEDENPVPDRDRAVADASPRKIRRLSHLAPLPAGWEIDRPKVLKYALLHRGVTSAKAIEGAGKCDGRRI